MKTISKYFSNLAKSKDRMFTLFFDSAFPASAVGLFTLSPKIACGVLGLLLIHGLMRDVVSINEPKTKNPTP